MAGPRRPVALTPVLRRSQPHGAARPSVRALDQGFRHPAHRPHARGDDCRGGCRARIAVCTMNRMAVAQRAGSSLVKIPSPRHVPGSQKCGGVVHGYFFEAGGRRFESARVAQAARSSAAERLRLVPFTTCSPHPTRVAQLADTSDRGPAVRRAGRFKSGAGAAPVPPSHLGVAKALAYFFQRYAPGRLFPPPPAAAAQREVA